MASAQLSLEEEEAKARELAQTLADLEVLIAAAMRSATPRADPILAPSPMIACS
jgi:hypothetical protein